MEMEKELGAIVRTRELIEMHRSAEREMTPTTTMTEPNDSKTAPHVESQSDESTEDDSRFQLSRRSYVKAGAMAAAGAGALSGAGDFVGTAQAYMTHDPAPEQYEIGGGIEYDNDVTRSDATAVVSTVSGLKTELGNAGWGDVVWVDNDATLDMDGEYNIDIPSGVTLASARGIDGQRGALLHVDNDKYYNNALFKSNNNDVRVTGLQLRGPHPYYYCPDGHEPSTSNEFDDYLATGIWLYSSETTKDVEVDNCHMWGWSRAAVSIGANSYETGSHVHHCSFHDNATEHYGYGVNLFNGESLIDNCYFGLHRHCIVGNGNPENSYEAHSNIVGGYETVSHAFDMHNWASNNGDYEVAGDTIYIHHNTFEYNQEVDDNAECDYFTRTGGSQEYIKIRGEPDNRCDMDNNWFKRKPKPDYNSTGSNQTAYNQDDVDSWSSMYESNNEFDTLSEPASNIGHPRPDTALEFHSEQAVDQNGNGNASGVSFQVDNNTNDTVTIFLVTVSPYKYHHNLLSDAVTGEGQWQSEIHIDADGQSSTCDIDKGTALPAEINLSNDNDYGSNGWAIMSANSTAETNLYRFFYESGGSYYERDMAGEDVAVSFWYHRYDTDVKETTTKRLQL